MEETDVKNSVNRGWDLSAAAWFYSDQHPAYELGIPIPWNPYNSVYDQISGTNWTRLFDAVILFSPIVALSIVVLSQVRISGGEGRTVLARIEIRSASRLAYAVVGISVGLLGVMGLYLIFENLPCLLGQQVIC